MRKQEFTISREEAGERIDVAASARGGITRSQVQRLIEKGLLTVNGRTVKPNLRTREGDVVRLTMGEDSGELMPEDIPLQILHTDESVLVVNKPSGMVVYPGAGHSSGTLMNAVALRAGRLATVGGPLRPGVVHRLDKDTSGVMVIALDDQAYYDLVEQFRKRTITRRYKALVFGSLRGERGEIGSAIGRSESDRKRMTTRTKKGKEALTSWRVIEHLPGATLIEARLGTGRTHQIRVHLASIGHPVLGDRTYGKKSCLELGRRRISFPRQMLHAETLGFIHPSTRQYVEFGSPLPEDMEEKLRELRSINRTKKE